MSARTLPDSMFRELLEAQAEAIVIVDARGEIVLVNARAEEMFGYKREELLGQRIEILIPRSARRRHEGLRHGYSAEPHTRPMGIGLDLRAARKDGTEFPAEVSLSTHETAEGRLITSRIIDITARKQAEAALLEAEERFRLAFENAPIGMALVGIDGSFLRVNRAMSEITGHGRDALLERRLHDLAHPDDLDADVEKLDDLLDGRIRSFRSEKRRVNASGETVWATLSVSLVRDLDGQPLHFIAQLEDISERKLMEDRLRHLADYDSLTGVRNRRQFEHDLSMLIDRCQRYGEEGAMLMLDLDGFKAINDTYGHRVGDDVLKAVATAIRRRLRSTDTVARLGGDEFAVLLPHVSKSKAAAVADDVSACIRDVTVMVGVHALHPNASIGVATIDRHTRSKDPVLIEADRAMYAHKRAAARHVVDDAARRASG
jgi:diguanylate cyclase (GGDEF)-like protein/PAS domain S-box-containing protein